MKVQRDKRRDVKREIERERESVKKRKGLGLWKRMTNKHGKRYNQMT